MRLGEVFAKEWIRGNHAILELQSLVGGRWITELVYHDGNSIAHNLRTS
jgi:hypothetical protein